MRATKSAKKSKMPKRQRSTTGRPARKATPKALPKETIQLELAAPELAQLDTEVARQKNAAGAGTDITRISVLLGLVRGLPSAPPRCRTSKATTDTHGRYMDVTVGTSSVRFRWIEPGTFEMGSPSSEMGRYDDEGPQHKVTLTRGYWLADTPVTQALWEAVMGNNHSRFKGADRPVEMVNWDDAKAFIARLNTMVPELEARLPTEAEWENACRAGTKTATWAGDLTDGLRDPTVDRIAWYYGNSSEGTRPVRGKAPNPIGLYDMLGNVYEWCEDWFGSYSAAKATDPRGPSAGSARVLRGGCWDSYARHVRAAYRGADDPGSRYDDGFVGFRLARGQQA